MKAGLVANPLNYRYTAPEIDHVLKITESSLLVAHAERDADIAQSNVAGRLPRGILRYAADDDRNPSLEELINREPDAAVLPEVDPEDPGFIIFTSGSTGLPKGVTHSFETFGWALASIVKGLALSAADILQPATSFSHGGGIHTVFSGLAAGGKIVLARTTDADELLPLLREHRPSIMGMLPSALFRLIRDHGATQSDFASFRFFLSGGDHVPAELEREFSELTDLAIEEGYGATEVGIAAFNPPFGLNKLGSVGCANPGFSLSIRDEDGNELPANREGRLWIKSPTVTIGYWNDLKTTEQTIKDGWLDSGDVMRVDEDGYFWFCGRKKQIIVHDGSNISPQDVEAALLEHPAVENAGVIGIHNLLHGENVRAYVTFRDDAERPTDLELVQFARERVGYKAPEEIVALDEMPIIADGKTDRTALKRMAEEQHAAAYSPPPKH